ncbi:MAG: methylenetetrahydrofolate reductase [Actinomycetota bacterium]|nr:methylenetetrahydrofolate reductase [Actinomycetota bacterium]
MKGFEWICEIEPPTKPELMHVRHQIGVLSNVASAYLVPDNHVGRATVSSIAVAHEVDRMGGRSIACLNARDRNMLGFRRDLLTGAAYGVDEFLFVYGDDPVSGARTGQLTVRAMIEHLRAFSQEHHGQADAFRAGVTTRLAPLPDWKRRADFLFVQVAFSLEDLLAWRDTVRFDGDVYAGVMVLSSASMARKLVAHIPEISVPSPWLDAVERDRSAGVKLACELAHAVCDSGAFNGVHLIPGVRYRETASVLEKFRPQR